MSGDRITNILILAVTLFLSACSMNSKLDQNLAEMKAMNKNMADMNQNMANGIKQFGDVGASVKTLSDEAVIFLRKTDPQQYFDMFNQISDKFEAMLAGLMDQTGDIKTFIDQANECTSLFLAYSKALTPEDMTTIKDSFEKIAGMTTQINDLLSKSDNYEAMANQVMLTTQMFTAVGLSLAQSLDVIDPKDTQAMLDILNANMKNAEMLGSAGELTKQMMEATEKVIQKTNPSSNPSKNNNLRRALDALPKFLENLSTMWDSKAANGEALNEWLYGRDKEYKRMICSGINIAMSMMEYPPSLETWMGSGTVKPNPQGVKAMEKHKANFAKMCKGYLDMAQ